jgi:hypothetical protein
VILAIVDVFAAREGEPRVEGGGGPFNRPFFQAEATFIATADSPGHQINCDAEIELLSVYSICTFAYLHICVPTKSQSGWGKNICIFAYLGAIGCQKITKKLQKTPFEKNVPKCSFAYLRVFFQVEEITA